MIFNKRSRLFQNQLYVSVLTSSYKINQFRQDTAAFLTIYSTFFCSVDADSEQHKLKLVAIYQSEIEIKIGFMCDLLLESEQKLKQLKN